MQTGAQRPLANLSPPVATASMPFLRGVLPLLDRRQRDRAEVERLVAATAGHFRDFHLAVGCSERLVRGEPARVAGWLVDQETQAVSAGLHVLDAERSVLLENDRV
jgi:hypothetical protein